MTQPTPARVSGPGQLSQRTDNGQPLRALPDAKYGENKALMEQQRAAPLADGPDRPTGVAALSMPSGPAVGPNQGPAPEITPLSAPTAYPGQPVTTGMQTGPPGRTQPQLQPGQLSEALRPYAAADDSGVLNDLIWQLTDQGL